MKTASTVIDGYRCDLEVDDGTSHCWVNSKHRSASLEVLLATGVLTNDSFRHAVEEKVEQSTIASIEAWALENGY